MTWLTVVGLVLSCVIGVWRFFKRIKSERRKVADEAKKQLKEGLDNSDTSRITSSFDRMRRL